MAREPTDGATPDGAGPDGAGPDGASPDGTPPDGARPELRDAPPFASWSRIYLIVIGALAAQVILYAALTAAYR